MKKLIFLSLTLFCVHFNFAQESQSPEQIVPEQTAPEEKQEEKPVPLSEQDISNEECVKCHFEDEVNLKAGLGTDIMEYKGEKYVADELMCYSCHDGSTLDDRSIRWQGKQHSMGQKPSGRVVIPQKFPLTSDGKLYCGTCHSPHAIEGTNNLRAESINSSYCELCHIKLSQGRKTGDHPVKVAFSKKLPAELIGTNAKIALSDGKPIIICQTCHAVHGAPKEAEKLLVPQRCEICHENNPSRSDYKYGTTTHSIDVIPSEKIKIPDEWDAGKKTIKGKDGKLTCRTCHTPHFAAKETPMLIADNKNGAFCLKCHTRSPVSHPDMVKPKDDIKVADGVAVRLEEGMVTCNTCHISHNAADNKFLESTKTILTGNNDNSNFCRNCHQKNFSSDKQNARKTGNHPISVKPEQKLKVPEFGGRLGNESQVICNSCHRIHNGTKGTRNLIASIDNGELCGYCHHDTFSHPVNLTSKFIKVNKDILDAGGKLNSENKIICRTCHKSHGAYKNTSNLVLENNNSSFCIKCHSDKAPVLRSEHSLEKIAPLDKNIRGETQAESGICGACHLAHGGTTTAMFSREIDSTSDDPVSEMCISCHTKGKNGEKKLVGEYRHSTNVKIEEANRKQTSLPLYNESGRIIRADTKTVNKDGFVTCGSCHNVHQWDPLDSSNGTVENQEGDGKNSFLRVVYNKKEYKFCGECHIGYEVVEGTEHDMRVTAPKEKNSRGETAEESGVCESCHYVHNGNQANVWAKEVKGDADPITVLCRESCHWNGKSGEKKLIGENSHSVFVNMKYTDGETILPLYKTKDGHLMTCGTCHNVHQWDPEDTTAGRGKENIEGTRLNSFLRIKDKEESELCMDCHSDKPTARTEHDLRVTAKDERNIINQTADESGICGACHIAHNANDKILWSKELDTSTGKGSVITRECESCHSEKECGAKKLTGKITHPIDCGLPGYEVVPTLPLHSDIGKRMWPKEDEKNVYGNVTCATCHDAHRWDPNDAAKGRNSKNEEGNITNSFLRLRNDSTSVLCGDCHIENVLLFSTEHDLNVTAPKAANVLGQTVKESGVCGTCHLVHNGLELKLWARVPAFVKDDLVASLCFSCHSKGNCAEKKQTGKYSHPTGISIFDAGLTTSLPLFNPDITKRVDGKMYCNTCHSSHQWAPSFRGPGRGANVDGNGTNSFLRLRNDKESTLCLDCHQLEALMVNTDHDLSVTIPNEPNIIGELVSQSGSCSACHLTHNGGEAQRWAKPLGPGDSIVTKQCQSCHYEGKIAVTKVGEHSHPNDVKITKKDMSTSMPLYTRDGKVNNVEGEISCLTCHFAHQWSPRQYEKQDRASGIFDAENIRNKIMGKIVHVAEEFSYIDPTGYPSSRELKQGEVLSILKKKKIAAKLKIEKVNPFSTNFKIFAQTLSIDEDVVLEVGDEVLDDQKMQKGLEGDGRNSFLRKACDISTALCMDCHYKYIGTIGTDHDMSVAAPTVENIDGKTVFESGLCSACHQAHGGAGRSIAARELTVGQQEKENLPVFKPLCYGCHRDSGGIADPKKISVHHRIIKFPEYNKSLKLPEFPWPFYTQNDFLWKGKDDMYVSCATCHDPHQWDPERKNTRHPIDPKTGKYVMNMEGDDTNSFLRMRNDGWQLCYSCHLSEVHLEAEEMLKNVGAWQKLDKVIVGTVVEDSTTAVFSSTDVLSSTSAVATDTVNVDTTLEEEEYYEDLEIKPKVIAYMYERPVRIRDDFRISIVFSEALNPNVIPKITLIGDGKRSPVVSDNEDGVFGTDELDGDTYITPPIVMKEDMGGNITVVVEGAEGVISNVMDPAADHTFFFDTRPETLAFYRTAKAGVKEGSYTRSPEITLSMEAKGAVKVLISEDPDFKNAAWQDFVSEKKFILSPKDGEKIIYIRYKKSDDIETAPMIAKVNLAGAGNASELRGTVAENIRLTIAGSPYVIRGAVNLPEGFSMIIEEGVRMLFEDASYGQKQADKGKLVIEGDIIVQGDRNNPVIFTSRKETPAPEDWEGISIVRSMAQSQLEEFHLSYAKNGIRLEASSGLIKSSVIEKCSESGIVCTDRSDVKITECSITENKYGISVQQSNPIISKNKILRNKVGINGKAVSKPKIVANAIQFNEIGINCEEISSPWVLDNLVSENGKGVRCATYSPPIIANNEITKNSECGIYIDEACPMVFKNAIRENRVGVQIENDYRKFLISFNNIVNNIEYAVKMDKYIMQVNAVDNYWGVGKREIIARLIYDGNSVKEEIQESKDVEEKTFSMFTDDENEDEGEDQESKLGIVKYLPYQIEPIKDAGISQE